jgi:hypothetical protein
MRRNDLLTLLFDPRFPLLFVLGSIVLALLGNATYDLIVGLLGASPPTYLGLIAVSALIFFVLSRWFRELLRAARRRSPPAVKLPDEERSPPQPALVMLVGLGPVGKGPEWPVIEWHLQGATLRHCWLIVSPEGEAFAEELRYRLSERDVRADVKVVAGANQAAAVYQETRESLVAARRAFGDQVAVDITGGTKPMSAGAVLACLELGGVLEYLVTVRKPTGDPVADAVSQPMRVRLGHAPVEEIR